MDKRTYILYFCEQCGKSGMADFTKEDEEFALQNGGLFTRILDHGDHIIELRVDVHGVVRQEYIFRKIEFETSMELFRIIKKSDSRQQCINALKRLIGFIPENEDDSDQDIHTVKDIESKISNLRSVFESLKEEVDEVEKCLSEFKTEVSV